MGDPTPIGTQVNELIQKAHAKAYAEADIGSETPPDWLAARRAVPPMKMRGSAKRTIKTAAVPTVLVKQSVQKRKLVGEEQQGKRMTGDDEATEPAAEKAAEQQNPALEKAEKKHTARKRAGAY